MAYRPYDFRRRPIASTRRGLVQPRSEPVPDAIAHRARWLRQRIANGRYPLSPQLIADEIIATQAGELPQAMLLIESRAALINAIGTLSIEPLLILQAVFVDHRGADELALALGLSEHDIWAARRAALVTVRANLLMAMRSR